MHWNARTNSGATWMKDICRSCFSFFFFLLSLTNWRSTVKYGASDTNQMGNRQQLNPIFKLWLWNFVATEPRIGCPSGERDSKRWIIKKKPSQITIIIVQEKENESVSRMDLAWPLKNTEIDYIENGLGHVECPCVRATYSLPTIAITPPYGSYVSVVEWWTHKPYDITGLPRSQDTRIYLYALFMTATNRRVCLILIHIHGGEEIAINILCRKQNFVIVVAWVHVEKFLSLGETSGISFWHGNVYLLDAYFCFSSRYMYVVYYNWKRDELA